MTAPATRVTVFSNGLVDIAKGIEVNGGVNQTTVKIPVKRKYVGDVISTLAVYGNVEITSPPRFLPDSVGKIDIDKNKSLRSITEQFRGATVNLTYCPPGSNDMIVLTDAILVGPEETTVINSNANLEVYEIVVFDKRTGTIRAISPNMIRDFSFTQPAIQSEILASISKFQKEEVESVTVDFILKSLEDKSAPAIYQYVTPSAAWTFNYFLKHKGDVLTLEGSAVVHNNTDEAWNDVTLTVATGNPTSFMTDIAKIQEPQRETINITDNRVQAAAQVESTMGFAARGASKGVIRSAGMAPAMLCSATVAATKNYADAEYECGDANYLQSGAVQENADVSTVADAVRFTSKKPVSIPPRNSMSIRMFESELANSKMVLYHRTQQPQTVYQAVLFTNETGFNLVRGTCAVYDEGNYVGSAILSKSRPGNDQLVTYAVDSGVKVRHQPGGTTDETTKFAIGDRLCSYTRVMTSSYELHLECDHDKETILVIDHPHARDANVVNEFVFDHEKVDDIKTIAIGSRITVQLQPKTTHKLVVITTVTIASEYRLVTNNYENFIRHTLQLPSILRRAAFAECRDIAKQMRQVEKRIAEKNARLAVLEKKRTDLMQALKNCSDDGKVKYQTSFDAVYEEMEKINDVDLIDLKKESELLGEKLEAALAKVKIDDLNLTETEEAATLSSDG